MRWRRGKETSRFGAGQFKPYPEVMAFWDAVAEVERERAEQARRAPTSIFEPMHMPTLSEWLGDDRSELVKREQSVA